MIIHEMQEPTTFTDDPAARRPDSLRVFVVENHADTRLSLKLLLEQHGHSVALAATMEDALAALAGIDCDMLISDIGLPDGDGWELLRRAELPGSVIAVAMSGYGMHSDLDKSRAAGYRHHLVKPMALDQLEEILAEALEERQGR